MNEKTKSWSAVVLRAVLLACCIIGMREGFFPPEGGFINLEKMLYFTYQSNVWVLLLTVIYLVPGILSLAKGTVRIPRALHIARYSVAVAITITFLVYWLFLSPAFSAAENLSVSNQMKHTVVPLLFILDFLTLNKGAPMSKPSTLWALFLPLYYFVLSMVIPAIWPNHLYEYGGRYPYFFLNLDKYGWFGTGAGIGVFWWLLILSGVILVIGYTYRFIQCKTARKG
ncbi:MAG TPA: Pr6Pr family membrane protein [Candidatus Limiplasma sp.]|nr:Pr6Pr family membrane protein [Candidatus Limiplasma sp.]HRX08165.1 Pr6Pr family membrane protein [Candidatus Limiplasma sp.]